MRKERLIVPILAAVAVIWMVAQLLSSVLFERSLRQALEECLIEGIDCNIDLHKQILSDPGFCEANFTIHHLERMLKDA